ncbi:type VII toxin-antitoxin system HepT family RNase toxin [Natranaerobius thermophilus]|uniref:DUF86 domain-containing protein n=1 Tax=Natranaerobius thermophilus (strain ATCC BAA-1301 / DSM 18059 / JW/NM-WN-LF) TaxID=457570 RepID=B2A1S3_NATTJ|nr:DUF86 domain-containing protein [Natranaerobius thermophilus]ACB86120.1 protein of unknown function DUF86 [Natranaerobius thermophilus JW/NM-WN-LF]
MVNRESLQKRIEKAKEYIDFLEEINVKYSLEEYKNNKMVFGSVERFLHLTIEALIDIGNHIISADNLGTVNVYRDIPVILYDNNYINDKEKDLFIRIIGMRNVLVHDYLDIEKETVYRILTENLSDLKSLLKKYMELL